MPARRLLYLAGILPNFRSRFVSHREVQADFDAVPLLGWMKNLAAGGHDECVATACSDVTWPEVSQPRMSAPRLLILHHLDQELVQLA